jgi:mono/diheme cytochrome c family protein
MTSAQLYEQRCVSCHQPNGQGLPGTYPPLAGSEFATAANVEVPIRVLMHGMQGPVTVKGQRFESVMPAYGLGIEMSDEEVAAVLTYVRSSCGNAASAITPADVARVRGAPRSRTGPVTEEELRSLM